MQRVILAQEFDGLDQFGIVFIFEVPDEKFDLVDAVKKVCLEYCKTEEGQYTFDSNCNCFNWGDFLTYVPKNLCEKYGFKFVMAENVGDNSESVVGLDQQLVDEDDLVDDEN